MIRKMLICAAALVALMAAPAAAEYPFSVNPGKVTPGGQVSVSGEGCAPGAEVTITMTQTSAAKAVGDTIVVATIIADENGKFSTTFDLPPGTELGTYIVAATCGGEEVASKTIDVVSSDVTPTTTAPDDTDDGTIVRTGSDLNGLGLLGAGLLTAGGIILIATKTRRNEAKA